MISLEGTQCGIFTGIGPEAESNHVGLRIKYGQIPKKAVWYIPSMRTRVPTFGQTFPNKVGPCQKDFKVEQEHFVWLPVLCA